MQFLSNYAEFLAKALTITLLLLAMLAIIIGMRANGDHRKSNEGKLRVRSLNKFYAGIAGALEDFTMTKAQRKAATKAQKRADKESGTVERQKVFVLDFLGDTSASAVDSMRHEITAVLAGAKAGRDEVVVRLESPGGYISPYGLAASQLQRVKDSGISLTVCVDQVAASGGYLMACLADRIIAAPFSLMGSIGVVASVPNANRLLKRLDVDYEVFTAGDSKRTVTMLGENTEEGRKKFQEQLANVHDLFKQHVRQHRPQVDIDSIATGEAWHAVDALERQLIDELMTSDEYLATKAKTADVIQLEFTRPKKSAVKRLISGSVGEALEEYLPRLLALASKPR